MKPLEEDALIKGIVVRVLECDEDQRQTMVHEECAGNEVLLALDIQKTLQMNQIPLRLGRKPPSSQCI